MSSGNSMSPMPSTTSSCMNSDENLQLKFDEERKKKRMLSNRESARRSRMRKQNHLDDLTSQVALLRSENNRILLRMHATTQEYLTLESENAALRAQMVELSARLQSLTEMLSYIQELSGLDVSNMDSANQLHNSDPSMNPWNLPLVNQLPIAASVDIFHY